MPYDSLDELPKHIQKLPKKKQRQFKNVFNSVWEQNSDKPEKEREKISFMAANAAVSSKKSASDEDVSSFFDLIGKLNRTRVDHTEKIAADEIAQHSLIKAVADVPIVNMPNLLEKQSHLNKVTDVVKHLEELPSEEWDTLDMLAWITISKMLTEARDTLTLSSNAEEMLDWIEDNIFPMYSSESVDKTFNVSVLKADETDEERFVLGAVLIPDETDLQDDLITAEEIEHAAHQFMINKGDIGIQHEEWPQNAAIIVETYVVRQDLDINDQHVIKGSWMLGLKILSDEMWNAVKSGELTGFSIGGQALRRQIA